jgi:endonuclease/exonuclease/phosphatase family metal-dependent hydrolase
VIASLRGWLGGLVLCACAGLVAPASAGQDALAVLTYNVHGLPAWVARDDPAGRMPVIGARLGAYDLVLLQEDFFFHDRLRAAVTHPVVQRGNPSRMPWCPFCAGSGLTLLARLAPESVTAFGASPYGACAGWLAGGSDCLATKSFQRARLRLPGGRVLDVVNTHLDAGRREVDHEVRRRQLQALQRALEREVGDGALVVGGDFNLHADSARDAALLRSFASALSLEDTGARPAEGSGFPVIDYLFYRSGSGALLQVLEAGEDEAFLRAGEPLSDHPALFARFRVRAPSQGEEPPIPADLE